MPPTEASAGSTALYLLLLKHFVRESATCASRPDPPLEFSSPRAQIPPIFLPAGFFAVTWKKMDAVTSLFHEVVNAWWFLPLAAFAGASGLVSHGAK
jgi:hypothetical protein